MSPGYRRSAATVAMVGVVVYVVVDVVLQILPPHYSPISQAESDLAVGPFGWLMSINFFGRGITSAALIVAIVGAAPRSLARIVGAVLLAAAGFCSAFIAFFPTDIPAHLGGAPTTVHGVIHVVGASSGFVLAVAALWALNFWPCVRFRAARVFLVVASVGLVCLGLSMVVLPGILGLVERICLAAILGWVFVVARVLRAPGLGCLMPSDFPSSGSKS